MLSINATISQPAVGTTIATIGDQNTYISLTMRRLGNVIELVTGLTIYFGLSGHYEYEEIDREIVDDEDEAVAISVDLEYSATEKLISMDVVDYWKEPGSFDRALELAFRNQVADRDSYMAAAVAHNAALVAAE
jgi:hypothetical protein